MHICAPSDFGPNSGNELLDDVFGQAFSARLVGGSRRIRGRAWRNRNERRIVGCSAGICVWLCGRTGLRHDGRHRGEIQARLRMRPPPLEVMAGLSRPSTSFSPWRVCSLADLGRVPIACRRARSCRSASVSSDFPHSYILSETLAVRSSHRTMKTHNCFRLCSFEIV